MSSQRAVHERVMIESGAAQVQPKSSAPIDHLYAHEQCKKKGKDLNRYRDKQGRVILSRINSRIYFWLTENGMKGELQKKKISEDTGITYISVRRALAFFKDMGVLALQPYCNITRSHSYEIDFNVKVKICNEQSMNCSKVAQSVAHDLINKKPSYKLVSKFLKKLTNYIEYSEFWKQQRLTPKKCEEWIKEFYPDDPEALLTQLMFAEKTKSILNPKIKTSVDVFYGCLKNGGLTRPKDFEFPEERRFRIAKESREVRLKAIEHLKKLEEQEAEEANELAFLEFSQNKENVESLISKINFKTPELKKAIGLFRTEEKKSSRLMKTLRREYERID